MSVKVKVLQYKYDHTEKVFDGYFILKYGKEQFFSSTGRHQPGGLIDYKESFNIQLQNNLQYLDIELWDYWYPMIVGSYRMDILRLIKERKDMHILQMRNEKQYLHGELMVLIVCDEEVLIQHQGSIKSSLTSQQPSFMSGQSNSFSDNYVVRLTQYRTQQQSPFLFKK